MGKFAEYSIAGLIIELFVLGVTYGAYVRPKVIENLKPADSYCRMVPDKSITIETHLSVKSCDEIMKIYNSSKD